MESNAQERVPVTVPSYVEMARLAAKGPISAETRKSQQNCLIALTIFFVGYFNLVTLDEVELAGLKLTVSLQVMTILALIIGTYLYLRFLLEAWIEKRLFEIEFYPKYDVASESLNSRIAAFRTQQTELRDELEKSEEKMIENAEFTIQQNAKIASIMQEYEPHLDRLKKQQQQLEAVLEGAGETASPARSQLMNQLGDVQEKWNELHDEMTEKLRPLRDQACPHATIPELDNTLEKVAEGFLFGEAEYTLESFRLAKRRGQVTTWFDLVLPSLMMAAALVCVIKLVVWGA